MSILSKNFRKTDTIVLAAALDVLARDIQSSDGVANAAIAEGAQRLRELEKALRDTKPTKAS